MAKKPSSSSWFVYILRCRDESLYTGITVDINRRLEEHNRRNASRYTAARHPVRLVYLEPAGSRSSALKREAEIKSWEKKEKEELILHTTERIV